MPIEVIGFETHRGEFVIFLPVQDEETQSLHDG